MIIAMVMLPVVYGVGSWGYILVKGYNITLRQWFSPLAPYSGPLDAAGTVPQGHIFPTGKGGESTGGPSSSTGSRPNKQTSSVKQRKR